MTSAINVAPCHGRSTLHTYFTDVVHHGAIAHRRYIKHHEYGGGLLVLTKLQIALREVKFLQMDEFYTASFTSHHCIESKVVGDVLTFALQITVAAISHESETAIKSISLQSLLEDIETSFVGVHLNTTIFHIYTTIEQITKHRTNEVCGEFTTVVLNKVAVVTHPVIDTSGGTLEILLRTIGLNSARLTPNHALNFQLKHGLTHPKLDEGLPFNIIASEGELVPTLRSIYKDIQRTTSGITHHLVISPLSDFVLITIGTTKAFEHGDLLTQTRKAKEILVKLTNGSINKFKLNTCLEECGAYKVHRGIVAHQSERVEEAHVPRNGVLYNVEARTILTATYGDDGVLGELIGVKHQRELLTINSRLRESPRRRRNVNDFGEFVGHCNLPLPCIAIVVDVIRSRLVNHVQKIIAVQRALCVQADDFLVIICRLRRVEAFKMVCICKLAYCAFVHRGHPCVGKPC